METMSTENKNTAGELLKQGRLRQRLSVGECAKRTHIAPRFIEALEDEKWDVLPSESHRLGFLRLYSRFLGVSTDEVMTLYKKRLESVAPDAASATPSTPAPQLPKRAEQPRRIRATPRLGWAPSSIPQLIALAGLLLVLFWVVYHWAAPRLWDANVVPWSQRKATSEARLSVPSKPLVQTHKIAVKALEDCWMRVTADNVLLYEGILRNGSAKEWSGVGPFFLKIGNVKALALQWNDQPVDLSASAKAGTSTVRIPPQ